MKKTVRDVNVAGKRCLVRVDFNVPLDDNGQITDDNRIVCSLPTIEYLLKKGAKVILMSHLGRPKGVVNPAMSLRPAAERLSVLLRKEVKFATDTVGESAQKAVKGMKNGEIVMLENLRFHIEEEKNDAEFAKKLASFADVFVNDAFGTAHRAHASTEGVSHFLPVSVSGFLIEKEIKFMGGALENPKRPLVAILGGSKVSDKINVINSLLNKVDTLLVGGGMAYTFLAAKGYKTGTSICERDKLDLARQLMKTAEKKGVKLILPADNVVAEKFSNDSAHCTVDSDKIPDNMMGMDIGKKTIKLFSDEIKNAGTVLWNGPAGVFEMSNFANGTKGVAKALAKSKAISIIGGGDSAAAVIQMGLADKITHISTGGGASLEFLEGKKLPGIECLND